MPVPQNKEELIAAIEQSYAKLTSELNTIPERLTRLKELEGHAKGTQMSISDLVAYLIGWGELVLKWNHRKKENLEVDYPETGYKWNQLGLLAQKFYKDYEEVDYQSLLKRLDSTNQELLKLIQKTSNHELYEKPWYDKWPLGKMLQLNTSSPYKNATARIRRWKKRSN